MPVSHSPSGFCLRLKEVKAYSFLEEGTIVLDQSQRNNSVILKIILPSEVSQLELIFSKPLCFVFAHCLI